MTDFCRSRKRRSERICVLTYDASRKSHGEQSLRATFKASQLVSLLPLLWTTMITAMKPSASNWCNCPKPQIRTLPKPVEPLLMIPILCITLRTLNYGNSGTFPNYGACRICIISRTKASQEEGPSTPLTPVSLNHSTLNPKL